MSNIPDGETIQRLLKNMSKVYLETTEDAPTWDAFNITLFSDGSGRISDGGDMELFDFVDKEDLFDTANQWMLDQHPDPTTPDVYDGMDNDDIEEVLATNLYDLLIGITLRESAIPFPALEVDYDISSVVINLAGRKATISIDVENDDVDL